MSYLYLDVEEVENTTRSLSADISTRKEINVLMHVGKLLVTRMPCINIHQECSYARALMLDNEINFSPAWLKAMLLKKIDQVSI